MYSIGPKNTANPPAPWRSRVGWVLLFAVLPVTGWVHADRVVFRDRRILRVAGVERDGEWIVLHMSGDNFTRVHDSQVLEIIPERPDPIETERRSDAAWRQAAGPYETFFAQAAERYGIEPALLLAIATVESGMDPDAVSAKGAMGLMQLMPATADELSVEDPHDPGQNIDAGAAWLQRMMERFEGDLDLALAAYNAGEGAVRRFGGVPPYQETKRYVREVRKRMQLFRGGGGTWPG